jgi:hypothetical protein
MVTIPGLYAQPELMMFPLHAVIEFPQKEKTADACGEVEAADGHRYYVKEDKDGKAICASEWLCTRIAEEVGIAGPQSTLVQMLDGRLLFGSRRVSNVADQATTLQFLNSASEQNRSLPVAGLQRVLSNIYALDMFIHNVDRHLGNYLSVEESGVRRIYAMDYSRSLFWAWPFSGFPHQNENTLQMGRLLRSHHGFDLVAASAVLQQLGSLAPAVIEGFINRMPPAWLPGELKSEFMNWWSDGGRTARLTALRMGLENGQLL